MQVSPALTWDTKALIIVALYGGMGPITKGCPCISHFEHYWQTSTSQYFHPEHFWQNSTYLYIQVIAKLVFSLLVQITSWSNFCFTDQVWLMRATSLKKAQFPRYMVEDGIFDQFSQRVETMYQTIFGPVRSSSLYDYQTHFHHLYLRWISIASIFT